MTVDLRDSPVVRPGLDPVAFRRTYGARLRDVFNVKEYGAKGDGIQDDSVYIQQCIDTANDVYLNDAGQPQREQSATIFFPPGEYKITKTLIVECTGGMSFDGSGAHMVRNSSDGSVTCYGSVLKGNFPGYLLYSRRIGGGVGISRITSLGFCNTNGTIPRAAQPSAIVEPYANHSIIGASAGTGGVWRLEYSVFDPQFTDLFGNRPSSGVVYPIGDFPVVIKGVALTADGSYHINSFGPATGPPYWIELPGVPYVAGTFTSGGTVTWDGDAVGCLCIADTNVVVENCSFMVGDSTTGTGGMGMANLSNLVKIKDCIFEGPYQGAISGTTPNYDRFSSTGIFARNIGIDNCYFTKFGSAVAAFLQTAQIKACIINHCNCGAISSGGDIGDGFYGCLPYDYWEADNFRAWPRYARNSGYISANSCFFSDVKKQFINSTSPGLNSSVIKSSGSYGTPENGIMGGNIGGYLCSTIDGVFSKACFDLNTDTVGGGGNSTGGSVILECLVANVTGGTGVPYRFPGTYNNSGDMGAYVRGCKNFYHPYTVAQLPSGLSTLNSYSMLPLVCSNSADPVWTGSVSNAGKPLASSGSNQVLVQWSKTAGAWVIVG